MILSPRGSSVRCHFPSSADYQAIEKEKAQVGREEHIGTSFITHVKHSNSEAHNLDSLLRLQHLSPSMVDLDVVLILY
jgi:hypothetical protein